MVSQPALKLLPLVKKASESYLSNIDSILKKVPFKKAQRLTKFDNISKQIFL
jgi:hypothetical protein